MQRSLPPKPSPRSPRPKQPAKVRPPVPRAPSAIPVSLAWGGSFCVIVASTIILATTLPALVAAPSEAAVDTPPSEPKSPPPPQAPAEPPPTQPPPAQPPPVHHEEVEREIAPPRRSPPVPSDMSAIDLRLHVFPKDAAVRIKPTGGRLELSVKASGYRPESRVVDADVARPITLRLVRAPHHAHKHARAPEKPGAPSEVFLSGAEL